MTPQEEITQLKAHQSAQLQQLGGRVAQLEDALKPFARVADEYDKNCLDECRPEWNEANDQAVEILTGRGGKPLLSLHHFQSAQSLLRPAQEQAPTKP